MGFLKDFHKSITDILDGRNVEVSVNNGRKSLNVSTSEEDILQTIIRENHRLIKEFDSENLIISIYVDGGNYLVFNLREFPSCCGKIIMHGIKFINYGKITTGACKSTVKSVIALLEKICIRMRYSSIDFIVSEEEQPLLLKCLKEIEIKERFSFVNRRGSNSHTCHNFSIDVDIR